MMTSRERLSRCFFHRELDRPAVYSRTGFPKDDPTYDGLKALLAQHTELKIGWSGYRLEPGYPLEIETGRYSDDFVRRTEILHTPAGELRRSSLESLKGEPGLHETYFVNGPEDARRYLSLPLPGFAGDFSSFHEADAVLGGRGIVVAGLGMNPGGFVAELCGSENFALMSVSDRDILHELCRRQMEIMLRRVKFLAEGGAGPFFSMLGEEYIVPPLHGPADFADFNARYDKPVIDLVHEAGGRMHIHSHGAIGRVIKGFVEMGTDVLHPFEPPPQGDITARGAKAAARGRMCLEGNIQINRMYEAEPDEVRQETEALIADAFDDRRGLIVSPSASPYIRGRGEACLPRYRAMVEAVLHSGAAG